MYLVLHTKQAEHTVFVSEKSLKSRNVKLLNDIEELYFNNSLFA